MTVDNNNKDQKPDAGQAAVNTKSSWFSTVKSFFFGSKDEALSSGDKAEEKDELNELLNSIEPKPGNLMPASVPVEMQEDFADQLKQALVAGFKDGVSGIRSESIVSLAEAEARETFKSYAGTAAGQIDELQEKISGKEILAGYRKKQLELQYDYCKYMLHFYKFNERGNTIGEFIMYFILFLLLFFADIPIGTELLKGLFSGSNSHDPIPFTDLFRPGMFIPVIVDNWQPLWAAVGISVSTIYFKIVYDEFVGSKYGHSVVSKKRFEELFSGGNGESSGPRHDPGLTSEEKSEIQKRARQVKQVKIGLLVFTLFALVIVCLFRIYGWQDIDASNEEYTIPVWVIILAMSGLTLLFAIMSGVCLSIALNSLTNYRRTRAIKSQTLILEEEFEKEISSLANLKNEQIKISKNLAAIGSVEDWIKQVTSIFRAYYTLGFNHGILCPGYFMRDKSFFERICFARSEDAARKINNHLSITKTEQ